jgi:hypothetical protein
MTPDPRDEVEVRSEPDGAPLDSSETARHLEHLGMSPEAAATYAAFVSGRYAAFRRRPN